MKEFNVNLKERTLVVIDDNDNIQEWNIVPKCNDTTTSDLEEILTNLDKLCCIRDENVWKMGFSSPLRNEILAAYLNSNIIDIIIYEEHCLDTGMKIRLRFDETGNLIDMLSEDKYESRGAINNKDLREFVDLIFEKNDKLFENMFTLGMNGDILTQLREEINGIYESESYKNKSLVVDGTDWEYKMTLINDPLPSEIFTAKYETYKNKNVSVLEVTIYDESCDISDIYNVFYVHVYFKTVEVLNKTILEPMIDPDAGQVGYVNIVPNKINNPRIRNLLLEMKKLFDINE